MERLCRLCSLSHTISHAGVLLTDDGNTAQSFEQDAEGEEEPLLLHQEIALHASGTSIKLAENEIPIGGVWSQADNKLIRMILSYLCGPSPMFI